MDKAKFQRNIESFKWESKEQREGYLALIKFKNDQGKLDDSEIDLAIAFLIQKQHESNLWILEQMGDQISRLQDEIKRLTSI